VALRQCDGARTAVQIATVDTLPHPTERQPAAADRIAADRIAPLSGARVLKRKADRATGHRGPLPRRDPPAPPKRWDPNYLRVVSSRPVCLVERSASSPNPPYGILLHLPPAPHGESENPVSAYRRLLVIGRGGRRQIDVEERDVPLPLIGFALSGFYELGGFIETGTGYGTQVSATLSFLWLGRKRRITGAVVPLVDGPDLVIPIGLLEDDIGSSTRFPAASYLPARADRHE
jgi:hypothetical protein